MDVGDPAFGDEVRAVFGTTDPVDLRVEDLAHHVVASATVGIWRVRSADRSAVVKVLAQSDDDGHGHENWRSSEAEDHWYYWRREALAYGSGLLGSLAGGLRAPECYLVADRDDGSVALWLEDLPGVPGPIWPVDRFGPAAQQLGHAQGEFVAGRPIPADRWLSRGWLPAYLRQRDRDVALLEDPAAWQHPLVAAWFPDPPVDALVALRHNQDRYLQLMSELPATVSHLDMHPANLFDADGDTVAVDWAFVGVGALGEDPGNLVPDSVLDFHVPPRDIDRLYDTVADGYDAGLRAAGWDGPRGLVRLAMSLSMVAKYAWIAPAVLRAVGGERLLNGRPLGEALPAWAATVHFLLARAEEVAAVGSTG